VNLAIPPDGLVQAIISVVAGVVALLLGLYLMHRAWNYRDHRSERDFIIGFCLGAGGGAWVVLGVAIWLGLSAEGTVAEAQIRELVVFTNATVRSVVFILGAHVLLQAWKDSRRAR